jgi:hypothetical protein
VFAAIAAKARWRRRLVEELAPDRIVVALALRAEPARPVPSELAAVLGSHTAIHAAEGELYREAFAAAAERLGIDVTRTARAAGTAEAAAVGAAEDHLDAFVSGLRRSLGPPWQADHRLATTGAIGALAGRTELRVPPEQRTELRLGSPEQRGSGQRACHMSIVVPIRLT